MQRYPKQKALADQSLRVRAQALFERGVYDSARADFHALFSRAVDDEERLSFLLREADCLAKANDHAGEIALLQDQLSHEALATAPTTTGGPAPGAPGAGFSPRRARVLLRLGAAYGRAGEYQKGLDALRTVLADYPKSSVSAEAQFRIGYFEEVYLQDFAQAREEYAKVRDQSSASEFVAQAQQRMGNLERLEQTGGGVADTLARRAEKDFVVAENTLLELNDPERAVGLYLRVARDYPTTPQAPRALNAAGWALERKLGRPEQADSLFWVVIHSYRGTEQALAARDYLEYDGHEVPDSLIVMPAPPAAADTLRMALPPEAAARMDLESALHRPPGDSLQLGPPAPGRAGFGALRDTLAARDSLQARAAADSTPAPAARDTTRTSALRDTTRRGVPRDTTRAPAPRDSVERPQRPDSSGACLQDDRR
jgi:tetratricopeptide (TPR) repeat protein